MENGFNIGSWRQLQGILKFRIYIYIVGFTFSSEWTTGKNDSPNRYSPPSMCHLIGLYPGYAIILFDPSHAAQGLYRSNEGLFEKPDLGGLRGERRRRYQFKYSLSTSHNDERSDKRSDSVFNEPYLIFFYFFHNNFLHLLPPASPKDPKLNPMKFWIFKLSYGQIWFPGDLKRRSSDPGQLTIDEPLHASKMYIS
jgi:hypothetical protein